MSQNAFAESGNSPPPNKRGNLIVLNGGTSQSVLSTPDVQNDILPVIETTARKRVRVKARYQEGHIERLGNWFYIRFRIDTPEGRKLVAHQICPVEGQGSLTAAQQRRKANEIIMASQVNNTAKIMETSLGTTFSRQAEWFLDYLEHRTRRPVAPSTLETWRSAVDKWLTPNIGKLPLSEINNAVAKSLVAKLVESGLSNKSVTNIFGLAKMIVASAVNDEGEEIFPRKWNHDFIQVPIVDGTEQHKPTVSAENITAMLANTEDKQLRMLIILAAASGLRLGEILGLSISNISEDGTVLTIVEKAYRSDVHNFLKTKNGKRLVDLTPEVGQLLREYIGKRTGLLFATKKGKPLSQSNILRRQLHPLQEKLEIQTCGAHAFRRFRITHLRKNLTPDGLVQFWAGHNGRTITDGYDKVKDDVEFRKQVCKSVGLGFTIPTVVVQNVQEIGLKEKGQTVDSACPA